MARLSVLFATNNGADTIDRTLAAMAQMETPPGGWRLVVVNNASTDDTEARVLRWRDHLPLVYVTEPTLGKSVAINTGLRHAEGDFIVMTDDDVLPDPDWLKQWRRIADAYPQCSVFGGAIVPEFDGGPPAWPIPDWGHTVLYAQTPPYAEGEIAPMNVSGPNMAIRSSVYEAGWRFGEHFMVGGQGLMGEDSDFVRRLAKAGHKIGFSPHARVRHIIHKKQRSLAWIYQRFYRHGRTMFMLDHVQQEAGGQRPAFSFPWRRVVTAIRSIGRLALVALSFNRTEIMRQVMAIAYDVGAVRQAACLSNLNRRT